VSGVSGTLEIRAWWPQRRKQFSRDQVAESLDRVVIGPILRACGNVKEFGRAL
jgi:hypothetical protein